MTNMFNIIKSYLYAFKCWNNKLQTEYQDYLSKWEEEKMEKIIEDRIKFEERMNQFSQEIQNIFYAEYKINENLQNLSKESPNENEEVLPEVYYNKTTGEVKGIKINKDGTISQKKTKKKRKARK